MNKEMGAYLKGIENSLVCSKGEKKIFLKDLKNSIKQFIQEENVDDFSKVQERFGTATDIAESYLTTVDVADIRKRLSVKRTVTIVSIIIAIIFALFLVTIFLDTSFLLKFINDEEAIEGTVQFLCKRY